jgi:inorganic pyrophosphatase
MKLPPTFTKDGKKIFVVIETAKGNSNKYTYFPEYDFFKLTKVLPSGMVFPLDFGFIPGTKGEDGDPLDVLVISAKGTFTGAIMECRIAGVIKAKQCEGNRIETNDRIIAVSDEHDEFRHIHSMHDINHSLIKEIGDFFVNYNKIDGKEFKVTGTGDADEARTIIASNVEKIINHVRY